MNNDYQTIPYELDECLTKGICTISPALSSIQEIVLLYLKELSFYLIKLKDFGVTNEAIKDVVIYALFNIVTNVEYNQEQFQEIISKLYDFIMQSKVMYEKQCLEHDIEIKSTKSYFKYSKKLDLTEAMKKGEKYFLKKNTSFTSIQKSFYDIFLFLIKSIAIKIVELDRLEKNDDEAYYAILNTLETIGVCEVSEELLREQLKKTIDAYYNLVINVFFAQLETYGPMSIANVSFSTEAGKAILVSGSDFKKVENVLEATKNTEISVYTHGFELIMTHAFEKFRSYPNFKGHYGTSIGSSVVDFATFPGAILMTKGTLQSFEYLFRGRLFTLDPVAPMGIVKIKDGNYEPLIKSALNAKGFSTAQKGVSMDIGFDESQIKKKIDEITDKIINNKIKHLYIIGLVNYAEKPSPYFEKFFKLLPKDAFALSFSHNINKENVYHLNSFCDYALFYKILKLIRDKKPLNEINISIFLTKCDKHTIANLLYLKQVGVKNVYTCKCPTSLINPTLMDTLQTSFGIKEMSTPETDINKTLLE